MGVGEKKTRVITLVKGKGLMEKGLKYRPGKGDKYPQSGKDPDLDLDDDKAKGMGD